jgi:hypothetical protein
VPSGICDDKLKVFQPAYANSITETELDYFTVPSLPQISLNFCKSVAFTTIRRVFDLHNRDHVRLVRPLLSFRLDLPGIRRILLNLTDDHVKRVFEHVELSSEHANFARNILAFAR